LSHFNRYFIRYRNQNLVILARSISEAIEPWARINFRSYTSKEFETALIKDPEDCCNCLMLIGTTITRDDLKLFHRQLEGLDKKFDSSKTIKNHTVEKKIIDENVKEKILESSRLEDFFVT